MSMPRSLLIAAALAAVLVTGLAIPVSAAKTKLAIVNGIPGKRVDVCVNGREVKSGLRYGKFVFKNTRTAKATVKFYKRDPRRCGGKLLAKKTSGIDDATFVATRRFPDKVVAFDNTYLAAPFPSADIKLSYGHAADVGAVEFSRGFDFVDDDVPFELTADTALKGEMANQLHTEFDQVLSIKVKQGGTLLLPPAFLWVGDRGGRRIEWILVGTAAGNARLVLIDRPGTSA